MEQRYNRLTTTTVKFNLLENMLMTTRRTPTLWLRQLPHCKSLVRSAPPPSGNSFHRRFAQARPQQIPINDETCHRHASSPSDNNGNASNFNKQALLHV
jgi:hypothetical protein